MRRNSGGKVGEMKEAWEGELGQVGEIEEEVYVN